MKRKRLTWQEKRWLKMTKEEREAYGRWWAEVDKHLSSYLSGPSRTITIPLRGRGAR